MATCVDEYVAISTGEEAFCNTEGVSMATVTAAGASSFAPSP
jgi:hypothetical protein